MLSVLKRACGIEKSEDNPVGSLDLLVTDSEAAYILGLWCADGYYRSSSIGLTNVDKCLIKRFESFLLRFLPKDRLRMRTYFPVGTNPHENNFQYEMRHAKQIAYQCYVNSRPLLRLFMSAEKELPSLSQEMIMPYFAGRFDGDGSIAPDLRSDLRIAYGNLLEAEQDLALLNKLKCFEATVYRYRSARTYVLYIRRTSAPIFLTSIKPFSVKVQSLCPVETRSGNSERMERFSDKLHKTLVSVRAIKSANR